MGWGVREEKRGVNIFSLHSFLVRLSMQKHPHLLIPFIFQLSTFLQFSSPSSNFAPNLNIQSSFKKCSLSLFSRLVTNSQNVFSSIAALNRVSFPQTSFCLSSSLSSSWKKQGWKDWSKNVVRIKRGREERKMDHHTLYHETRNQDKKDWRGFETDPVLHNFSIHFVTRFHFSLKTLINSIEFYGMFLKYGVLEPDSSHRYILRFTQLSPLQRLLVQLLPSPHNQVAKKWKK